MKLGIKELTALWRKNVPPPDADLLKYNSVVKMRAGDTVLYGIVCWSPEHKKYQFELVEPVSKTIYQGYELVLTNPDYNKLRNNIRTIFGVTITPGIHKQGKLFRIVYPPSLDFLKPTEV